jgi:hypothetical protein
LTAGAGVADDSVGVSRIVSGLGDVGNMEGEVNLESNVFSGDASAIVGERLLVEEGG